MIVGVIVESLIQTKDKISNSREKQALEEACNILSKLHRLDTYESIMNCIYLQKVEKEEIEYEDFI